MSEQFNGQPPRYYDGNHPCSLAGTGRCCKDRHQINAETRIAQSAKIIESKENGNPTTTRISWEPVGKDKLFLRAEMWHTELAYNRNLMRDLEVKAFKANNPSLLAHILDVTWTKTAVHTPANPDCPLLELLRQHKI